MSDLSEIKAQARHAGYARRRQVRSPERQAQASAVLRDALMPYKGRALSGYMAIRTEVDPLECMTDMAAFGPVCVPVIEAADTPLSFHAWTPGCAMTDGPFGARVPAQCNIVVPQVLIVPLIAFDANGGRLGYGGGFYDRTLEMLRAGGPVVAIGFAFAAQQADDLPLETTDQRLDAIVTENGLTRFV